ncbi:hypothetical protein [Gloeobacter morelensis]|uniref:Uncharacterized protein n=1 Tax=Gloeobacter morelensis MG652769 TaxID=2781736 RepID=A0ABY3PNV3_9CYAN|nr:hypothetical protein [Gloeobacter morelensis]UFP95372.1 hypothetical protein ISF26_03740 [Gloeobacter morelensis MG652769]
MPSVIICLLLLILVIPMMTATSINSQNHYNDARAFADQIIEKSVLKSALRTAMVAAADNIGGEQLQQEFSPSGLSVFVLSKPEVRDEYSIIRYWTTARPQEQTSGNQSTNNNAVVTGAYDPFTRIATRSRTVTTLRTRV